MRTKTNDQELERIAQVMRRWRKLTELTREHIATIAGRSLSTVTRWEDGKVSPQIRDIRVLDEHTPGLVAMLFPSPRRAQRAAAGADGRA